MINPLIYTNMRLINTKIKLLVLIGLAFVFFSGLASEASADNASIYLSPTTGTFQVGSTFDVSVLVNTGGNEINAIRVDLKFNPQKLQVASPTAGKSFISVWVSQPTYSNVSGTITFQGGMPSPGVNTSSGLVSKITFRAIIPGSANISVLETSQVLLNDGRGTDVLGSMGRGIYELVLPPPEGPKVFSPTHPDQNKWYKDNNTALKWEKEEGVTDFSYSIDKDFGGAPDNISEGAGNSISHADLEDSIWYFHVKAKKGNVWGGVTHYVLKIDTTPPAAFNLNFESGAASMISTQYPIISFITTDALSGLDHYELKSINLGKVGDVETEFFVEVISPHRLSLKSGAYKVIVMAYDKAGNWRDSQETARVIPRGKFVISRNGINFWIVFLSWWLIILILIVLIALILIIVILSRKYHVKVYRQREKIGETIKKRKVIKRKLKKE